MDRRSGSSAIETYHVDQGDGEVGRVSRDSSPGDALTLLAGVPGCLFGGTIDGRGPCVGCKESCEEDREGTHCLG